MDGRFLDMIYPMDVREAAQLEAGDFEYRRIPTYQVPPSYTDNLRQNLHVERFYALPNATRIFTCQDYQPGGQSVQYESTVGEQKATNTCGPVRLTV